MLSIANNPSCTVGDEVNNGAPTPAEAQPQPPPSDENEKKSQLDVIQKLLPAVLSRLSAGLPMHELSTIIKEACACEDALEREIRTLEKEIGIDSENETQENDLESSLPSTKSPLNESTMMSIPHLPMPYQPGGEPGKEHINYLESANAILETEFSPPDRYFTVSALLGRLREPVKLPYPPNSVRASESMLTKAKKNEQESDERKRQFALEKQKSLILLDENEVYHMEQPDSTALLAVHKKISSHRTAVVFRKPVNPIEAPGYTERIMFPMDLSLVRKLIVSRIIKSFSTLHQCVGLICHNCVKFNGRESDYAMLTREFEDHVDEKILEAVRIASNVSSETFESVSETVESVDAITRTDDSIAY